MGAVSSPRIGTGNVSNSPGTVKREPARARDGAAAVAAAAKVAAPECAVARCAEARGGVCGEGSARCGVDDALQLLAGECGVSGRGSDTAGL